jgi:hypothetical protein
MSGWCGSGGSALATAGERTSAAAQPNIAALWRASLNFISTPLKTLKFHSRFQAISKLVMCRGDLNSGFFYRGEGPQVKSRSGKHICGNMTGLFSIPPGHPWVNSPIELSNKPNTQSSTQRAAFCARSRRDF